MVSAGLRGLAVFTYSLAYAYAEEGKTPEKVRRERWRNVAFATRYGKGCGLIEALAMDMRSLGDYIEALSYCVEQENKAAKPKRR